MAYVLNIFCAGADSASRPPPQIGKVFDRETGWSYSSSWLWQWKRPELLSNDVF